MKRIWLACLVLLLLRPALAQAPDTWTAGLTQVLAEGEAPSISVAVVQNGKLLTASALGMADPLQKLAATPQTRYRIGSISKMFTAVAVMQRVQAGQVALDDRLVKYLPFVPHAAEISVRQLLQMRSGLPNYLDAALAQGRVKQPTTPSAILEGLTGPLDFVPGTAYEYSNSNFVALGLLVEHVSGMPLERYLQAHVFDPAKMNETTFANPPPGVPLALGMSGTQPADPGDPSWYYACGSLVSTASDLARFDIALMDGTLLSPALFSEMHADAQTTQEPGLGLYGLGMQIFPAGPTTLVGHHGGLPGFASDDEMVPGDRFAVVVLSNTMRFPTSLVLQLALKTFFPDTWKVLTSGPRPLPTDAYPQTTAAVGQLVRGIMAGQVDPATLDPAMVKGMTPAAVAALAARFAPLGDFQGATWLGVTRIGIYLKHHYRLNFSKKPVTMAFTVDPQGRFVGMLFE